MLPTGDEDDNIWGTIPCNFLVSSLTQSVRNAKNVTAIGDFTIGTDDVTKKVDKLIKEALFQFIFISDTKVKI